MISSRRTIELVGYGHPDRFADYISEKIMMEHFKKDINSKIAAEVMVTRNIIFLGGEINSKAKINHEELVYEAIEKVYGQKWWPNYKSEVEVIDNIKKQSPELNKLQKKEIVAGDQGVVFGYYGKERFKQIKMLYKLINDLREEFVDIWPDWKLLYNESIKELSISICGLKIKEHKKIKEFLEDKLNNIKIIVNPGGEWMIGGPHSDTGVTGRKLMIDTFGAGIPHGGGAFCGKDFSKIDKSGVLIASEIAYKYAKENRKEEVLVELHYKIGDKYPEIIINGDKDFRTGQESLNNWIERSKLLTFDWPEIVLKGGVIFSFGF
ncbi:MAG: S-adenosylmethionine synthase [Candidatus Hepatoplasma vulgare]|nr:MAG: S-adenosylmethionine synthase [Candidatus Hepatoplasma sp.]